MVEFNELKYVEITSLEIKFSSTPSEKNLSQQKGES